MTERDERALGQWHCLMLLHCAACLCLKYWPKIMVGQTRLTFLSLGFLNSINIFRVHKKAQLEHLVVILLGYCENSLSIQCLLLGCYVVIKKDIH